MKAKLSDHKSERASSLRIYSSLAALNLRLCLLLAAAALCAGLLGCKHTLAGKNHGENHGVQNHGLELNHGHKWVVVPPMMAHVRSIEGDIAEFEDSSSGNHVNLAGAIQENLGLLVTSCTMKGKAHDELHKWLMPFLGLSADYVKASEPNLQEEKLRDIKQALLVFNQYFE